jgi:predicted hotdog family 3-hydroxylacyl-ACP dehydratase
MIADKFSITEYLPQRQPVVMIDSLLEADEKRTVSSLKILSDNIFCNNGFFSESGLVENIAQTAAAGVGYICKREGRTVPVGFIASIRDLTVARLPEQQSVLITETVNVDEIMGVSIVRGTVKCGEEVIAGCEMRIFVKPE